MSEQSVVGLFVFGLAVIGVEQLPHYVLIDTLNGLVCIDVLCIRFDQLTQEPWILLVVFDTSISLKRTTDAAKALGGVELAVDVI